MRQPLIFLCGLGGSSGAKLPTLANADPDGWTAPGGAAPPGGRTPPSEIAVPGAGGKLGRGPLVTVAPPGPPNG